MPADDVRLGMFQSLELSVVCSTYLLLCNDVWIKMFYIFSEEDIEATDGRGMFKVLTHKIHGDRVLILKKSLRIQI